jgi:hypothetical protein
MPCDSCRYYATWYRHYTFRAGWTVDDLPLGHPLGGNGWEWLAHARWDAPAERTTVTARTFLRGRGAFNMFAQAHRGRSLGTALTLERPLWRRLDLTADGSYEYARTWHEASGAVAVRAVW